MLRQPNWRWGTRNSADGASISGNRSPRGERRPDAINVGHVTSRLSELQHVEEWLAEFEDEERYFISEFLTPISSRLNQAEPSTPSGTMRRLVVPADASVLRLPPGPTAVASSLLSSEQRSRLRSCISSPLPLLVFGHNSCGKSTFINALLGIPLMPTSTGTTTARICRITFAERKDARIVFSRVDAPRERTFVALKKDEVSLSSVSVENLSEALRPHLLRDRMPAAGPDRDAWLHTLVEVHYPFDGLEGFELYDAPGISSADEIVFTHVASFIRHVRPAVLFVYRNASFSDEELSAYFWLGQNCGPIEQQSVLFVCGQSDVESCLAQVDTESETAAEDLAAEVKKELARRKELLVLCPERIRFQHFTCANQLEAFLKKEWSQLVWKPFRQDLTNFILAVVSHRIEAAMDILQSCVHLFWKDVEVLRSTSSKDAVDAYMQSVALVKKLTIRLESEVSTLKNSLPLRMHERLEEYQRNGKLDAAIAGLKVGQWAERTVSEADLRQQVAPLLQKQFEAWLTDTVIWPLVQRWQDEALKTIKEFIPQQDLGDTRISSTFVLAALRVNVFPATSMSVSGVTADKMKRADSLSKMMDAGVGLLKKSVQVNRELQLIIADRYLQHFKKEEVSVQLAADVCAFLTSWHRTITTNLTAELERRMNHLTMLLKLKREHTKSIVRFVSSFGHLHAKVLALKTKFRGSGCAALPEIDSAPIPVVASELAELRRGQLNGREVWMQVLRAEEEHSLSSLFEDLHFATSVDADLSLKFNGLYRCRVKGLDRWVLVVEPASFSMLSDAFAKALKEQRTVGDRLDLALQLAESLAKIHAQGLSFRNLGRSCVFYDRERSGRLKPRLVDLTCCIERSSNEDTWTKRQNVLGLLTLLDEVVPAAELDLSQSWKERGKQLDSARAVIDILTDLKETFGEDSELEKFSAGLSRHRRGD